MRLPELTLALALTALVGCSQLRVPLGASAENNPATRGVGSGTSHTPGEDWRAGVTPATRGVQDDGQPATRQRAKSDSYAFAAADARSDKATRSRRTEARSRHRSVMKKKPAQKVAARKDAKSKRTAANPRRGTHKQAEMRVAPKPAGKSDAKKSKLAKKGEAKKTTKPKATRATQAKVEPPRKQVAKRSQPKAPAKAERQRPAKAERRRPASPKVVAASKGKASKPVARMDELDAMPAKKVNYDDRGQAIDDEVPELLK